MADPSIGRAYKEAIDSWKQHKDACPECRKEGANTACKTGWQLLEEVTRRNVEVSIRDDLRDLLPWKQKQDSESK